MKYNDAELYEKTFTELIGIENRMTARQFHKWTVFRLTALVHYSTFHVKNWMDKDIRSLREYRMKAITFYLKKLAKGAEKTKRKRVLSPVESNKTVDNSIGVLIIITTCVLFYVINFIVYQPEAEPKVDRKGYYVCDEYGIPTTKRVSNGIQD